jgi:hypothetical protein
MNTRIFAGLEEIFARLIAVVIVTVGFAVVVVAREQIELEWLQAAGWLLFFWFLYEFVAIALFNLFVFFAKREPSPETQDLDVEDIESLPSVEQK